MSQKGEKKKIWSAHFRLIILVVRAASAAPIAASTGRIQNALANAPATKSEVASIPRISPATICFVCGGRGRQILIATLLSRVISSAPTNEACIWSVPAPPVSEYVNVAWPVALVIPVPVCPALGPLITLNVTVTPANGAVPFNTVAVTVCDPLTGLVAATGPSVMIKPAACQILLTVLL